MDDLDAGIDAQQFAGKVRHAAGPGGAEIDFTGPRLGARDQFPDVRDREVGRGDQQFRHLGDQRDQGQVLERIVEALVLQAVADRERSGAGDGDGVAVGIGLRHVIGAERAAGAGAVVDDHQLPEQVLHLLTDHSADVFLSAAATVSPGRAVRAATAIFGKA
jgi:hypothetical protein